MAAIALATCACGGSSAPERAANGAYCPGRVYVVGDAGEVDFQVDGAIVSREPVGGRVTFVSSTPLPCEALGAQGLPIVPCFETLPDGGQMFSGCK